MRPRKTPETSEVASPVEMREVVELATEKALRAFVERTQRAGLRLTVDAGGDLGTSHDDRFDDERDRGWQ